MQFQPELLRILNQVFEIEKKLKKSEGSNAPIQRNVSRIRDTFEEIGLRIYDPSGERYTELRTDCEASIAGNAGKELFIAEVIKPAILHISNGQPTLLQKAVVVADNK